MSDFCVDEDLEAVVVSYDDQKRLLSISATYDQGVKFYNREEIALLEFFKRVGVTKADCDKAWAVSLNGASV